jgi:glutamine amidotransferase
MTKQVAIIDYGHGNANSIKNALAELDVYSVYTSNAAEIDNADCLILPGVGHHRSAMISLADKKLIAPLTEAVMINKKPVLGICLGMQLMTDRSEEGGDLGLGWVRADTRRIVPTDLSRFKVPHVGWSTIEKNPSSVLLNGIETEDEPFYFCHSFAISGLFEFGSTVTSMVKYDLEYVAIFEKGNIFGVQFHPEKSQDCGLKLIKNFLSICD